MTDENKIVKTYQFPSWKIDISTIVTSTNVVRNKKVNYRTYKILMKNKILHLDSEYLSISICDASFLLETTGG